jgi:periplasmic protein TonB
MSTTAIEVKGPNKALFRSVALAGSAVIWGGLGYLALTYVPQYERPYVPEGQVVGTYTPPKPKPKIIPPPLPIKPPEVLKQKPLEPVLTPVPTQKAPVLTTRASKSDYANPLPSDLRAGSAPTAPAIPGDPTPLSSGREWEEPILIAPIVEPPIAVPEPEPVVVPAVPVAKLVVNPVRMTGANPIFPSRALERGISGQVTLSFTVSPTGQVENIEVTGEEPTGNGFARAARAAIQGWTFQPQTIDGVPVAYPARYTISFKLED